MRFYTLGDPAGFTPPGDATTATFVMLYSGAGGTGASRKISYGAAAKSAAGQLVKLTEAWNDNVRSVWLPLGGIVHLYRDRSRTTGSPMGPVEILEGPGLVNLTQQPGQSSAVFVFDRGATAREQELERLAAQAEFEKARQELLKELTTTREDTPTPPPAPTLPQPPRPAPAPAPVPAQIPQAPMMPMPASYPAMTPPAPSIAPPPPADGPNWLLIGGAAAAAVAVVAIAALRK